MVLSKRFLFGFLLWGLGLTALSYFSGYEIRGSVSAVNMEIVTMLTPAGMIHIFSGEDHWLQPYYQQMVRTGGGFVESPALTGVYFLFALISVSLLFVFRRGRNGAC